jgi:parvulin-like peptidyl-prolyl isomerase
MRKLVSAFRNGGLPVEACSRPRRKTLLIGGTSTVPLAEPRRQVARCKGGDKSPHSKGLRPLALITAFCLCVPAVHAEPSPVGDAEILASLTKLDAAEQAALAKDPALLKRVVQLTLVQRLLLREARENAWDQRPDVQLKMERAREAALAESWLQSVAEPPPDYPTEEEIKAAYEERSDSFANPRQYRLAQIFIACPKSAAKPATQKAEAKLAAVKKRLSAYREDFSTIARAESDDSATAANGGEIGWLSDAQIQPELRPHIASLLKHEVSAPVRLNDGWHILKCLDKREAGLPTLIELRSQLITQLRAEKTKASSEARVARLLKENPVTINEVALTEALNQKPK